MQVQIVLLLLGLKLSLQKKRHLFFWRCLLFARGSLRASLTGCMHALAKRSVWFGSCRSFCRFRRGELHPLVSARLRLSIVVNIINLTCAVRCGSRTLIRAVSCSLLMFLLIGICLPRLGCCVSFFPFVFFVCRFHLRESFWPSERSNCPLASATARRAACSAAALHDSGKTRLLI